jgi:hypothetical protein
VKQLGVHCRSIGDSDLALWAEDQPVAVSREEPEANENRISQAGSTHGTKGFIGTQWTGVIFAISKTINVLCSYKFMIDRTAAWW